MTVPIAIIGHGLACMPRRVVQQTLDIFSAVT